MMTEHARSQKTAPPARRRTMRTTYSIHLSCRARQRGRRQGGWRRRERPPVWLSRADGEAVEILVGADCPVQSTCRHPGVTRPVTSRRAAAGATC